MHATAAMNDAARDPEPDDDRPAGASWLQAYGLRAIIVLVGVVAAAGVIVRDDQDPIVFAIPILVATTMIVVAITLASSGARTYRRIAQETGLTYDGIRPVPDVTSLLRDDHAPSHMVSGPLEADWGPDVRVAFLRSRTVAIVDLSEQPAGARTALGEATRTWVEQHALRPRAELEDETLVVAVDREAPPRQLLELTRALVARL